MGGTFGRAGKMIIQNVSGVARPQPGATAGAAHSEPLPQAGHVAGSISVLRVTPAQNDSIYFIPYRYYIPSTDMVFSNQLGWDHDKRYQEFQEVMQNRMQADFPGNEAAIITQIFQEDIKFMFWEKAIQEFSDSQYHPLWGNKDAQTKYVQYFRKKIFEARKTFSARKNWTPPADFSVSALWFGSFSNDGLPGFFAGGKEHVGSIYFDGGRIRLMHSDGPTVEMPRRERSLRAERGNQKVLSKEDDILELSKRVAAAKKSESGGETLYEYSAYGRPHLSRGYPKKIILNNNEIAQLYYTIHRIDTIRLDSKYPKPLVNSAGNRLLIQFLRSNSRLRREFGYEGIL